MFPADRTAGRDETFPSITGGSFNKHYDMGPTGGGLNQLAWDDGPATLYWKQRDHMGVNVHQCMNNQSM